MRVLFDQQSQKRFARGMKKKILLCIAAVLVVILVFLILPQVDRWYNQTTSNVSSVSGENRGTTVTKNQLNLTDYTLVFVGDTGTGNTNQEAVANAIARHCGQFYCVGIFLLGDNFYPAGISSLDDSQWQTKFHRMYDQLRAVKYPALGNHDYIGCVQCQIDYTKREKGWYMPFRYYQITKENQAIFVIDTEQLDSDQLSLLREQLAKDPQTIVIGHRPIYTNETEHFQENFAGKNELKKILCETLATYISGHSHVMEYFSNLDSCGARQIVIGTGGVDLRGFVSNQQQKADFQAREFGFFTVDVKNDECTHNFWSVENKLLFSY